jgi:hypothetical protein
MRISMMDCCATREKAVNAPHTSTGKCWNHVNLLAGTCLQNAAGAEARAGDRKDLSIFPLHFEPSLSDSEFNASGPLTISI